MLRLLQYALAVSVLAISLTPRIAQAREERFLGQIVGTLTHEEETPEGRVQVFNLFGDLSRLGAFQGIGFQLVGARGEIVWGIAVFTWPRGESYALYGADRLPDGRLDGWFFFEGGTAYAGYYGYGILRGTTAPRLNLSLDGTLIFPD